MILDTSGGYLRRYLRISYYSISVRHSMVFFPARMGLHPTFFSLAIRSITAKEDLQVPRTTLHAASDVADVSAMLRQVLP